jgi:hypothetical protein
VICSLDQLNRIRGTYLSASFVLHTDIDAGSTNPDSPENAGSTWDNGGAGFDPIGNCGPDAACNTGDDVVFGGTFDGHGHTISNLFIDRPTVQGAGLFGRVSGSGVAIRHLRLSHLDVTGKGAVGGIVGYMLANLSDCVTSGSVSCPNSSAVVGGLVGQIGSFGGPLQTRTILRSSSSCTVTGGDDAGGLVGDLQWGAELQESFATGKVSGKTQVGGLVGNSYEGTIQDSYATGSASGTSCVGGLLGMGDFSTNTNIYAAGTATGTTRVGGLSGCQGNTTTAGVFATTQVVGTSAVGGIYGQAWGGSISNSYWAGGNGQPTVMCASGMTGMPTGGCNDSAVVNSAVSYWYSAQNAPMSAWSTSVWTFHADAYPTLRNSPSFPAFAAADAGTDSGSKTGTGGSGGAGAGGTTASGGTGGAGAGGTTSGGGAPALDGSVDASGSDASSASGGSKNSGGATSTGGTKSTGGATSSGGNTSTGGAASTGGNAGAGGSSTTGGQSSGGQSFQDASTALDSGAGGSSGESSSGCNCRTANTPTNRRENLLSLLGAGVVLSVAERRRRRGRK